MFDRSYIGKIATLQMINVMILVCASRAVTEIHSCATNCLNQIHILSVQDTYTYFFLQDKIIFLKK